MNEEQFNSKGFVTGLARKAGENVDETRTITFQISDASKDRHGTRLNMDNWNIDDFNRNPVIGYNHDVHGGTMCLKADPDDIIGTGRAYFDKDETGERVLMCDVTFESSDINPLAEKIFKKVKKGTLKATSVGFIPLRNSEGKAGMWGYRDQEGVLHDSDTFYYYGQELVELSIVNIPSNRNALKRNVRDTAANALYFLRDQLEVTTPELLGMSVSEVLKSLESGTKPGRKETNPVIKLEYVIKDGVVHTTPELLKSIAKEINKAHGYERILLKEENGSQEPGQALAGEGQRLKERKQKYEQLKREQ